MPTIKEILQEECNRESTRLVLFHEGKFWKDCEQMVAVEKNLTDWKHYYSLKNSQQ